MTPGFQELWFLTIKKKENSLSPQNSKEAALTAWIVPFQPQLLWHRVL
jgi:hypothetical protein